MLVLLAGLQANEPLGDPGLGSARVHSVMVAGEILLADGRPTLADEREVQREARAAAHRLWPRVAARATHS